MDVDGSIAGHDTGPASAQQQQQCRRRAPNATPKPNPVPGQEPAAETDDDEDDGDEGARPVPKNGGQRRIMGSEFGDEGSGSQGGASSDASLGEPEPDELYDPEADDQDEAWLQKQRQGRQSDAILSCPGCFTTLCVDCQQHHQFHNQYRAMFVMNCTVDVDKLVSPSQGNAAQVGRKRGADGSQVQGAAGRPDQAGSGELFHPVACEACGTEVGIVGAQDGLFVFYNAFPSNA